MTNKPWDDKYQPAYDKLRSIVGPAEEIVWDEENGMFKLPALKGTLLTPELILDTVGVETFIKNLSRGRV